MTALLAFAAGAAAGLLSGLGVGGGTLLIICMTVFFGVSQRDAQGINLLYFLPTAGAATLSHARNGLISRRAAVPAILAGLVSAPLSALAASALDTEALRKIFGALVTVVGLRELTRR